MKYLKWVLLAVAVIAAAYLNFSIYSWKGSVKEIEEFCQKISSGSDLSVVKSLVESNNSLNIEGPLERGGKETYLVHGTDNLGRATCTIEAANGLAVNAEFDKLDQ